jgi:hypothetical protein
MDVTLNSLTSPGMVAATLAGAARGGRVVEISKRDIWSPARVAQERPDVYYRLVAIDFLPGQVWAAVCEAFSYLCLVSYSIAVALKVEQGAHRCRLRTQSVVDNAAALVLSPHSWSHPGLICATYPYRHPKKCKDQAHACQVLSRQLQSA